MTLGLPHPNILPYIPRNLLCAVHATVCNLRGRQWGSQRPSLLFVSRHSFQHLVAYHRHILHELRSRGFKPSPKWSDPLYRGRKVDPWPQEDQIPHRPDLAYPHHSPADYRASLAYLRKRTIQDDQDRLRLTLAPEVVG
jgi:uncharacterized protein (TIGR02328 family)